VQDSSECYILSRAKNISRALKSWRPKT